MRATADSRTEELATTNPQGPIAKRYQIHPTQVTEWKKALQGNASSVFESTSAKYDEAFKQKLKEDRLLKQIGQLTQHNQPISAVWTSIRNSSRLHLNNRRDLSKVQGQLTDQSSDLEE